MGTWKRAESQDGQDQDSALILSLCFPSYWMYDHQPMSVRSCDSVSNHFLTLGTQEKLDVALGLILANGMYMEGTYAMSRSCL